jgi:hypothetical protein
MKKILAIFLLAIAFVSCYRQPARLLPDAEASHDSLSVTVTVFNLSEDMTGNDELLMICYPYKDTHLLEPLIFYKRLTLHSKNSSHQFKVRSNTKSPLILFLLEQDSDLPVSQVDSTLRVSHIAIRKEFAARNYSEIEKYLENDDVLGIKTVSVSCAQPCITDFTGIYKLDKYDYRISIECLARM